MTMEAATPLFSTRVQLAGDRLRLDGLLVDDPRAVALAREREQAGMPLDELVLQAIEIGARVIGREQTAADTEFVKAEFERQSRELEGQFAARAQQVGTDLTQRIDIAFGAEAGVVPKLLERHFGEGSSEAVQHRVRSLVDDLLRGHREQLAKQFSAADATNPLAQFQQSAVGAIKQASSQQQQHLLAMNQTIVALQGEVSALKAEKEKTEAVAGEAERGTAKGRTYEEQVADALAQIASARGDCAEQVGDSTEGGGKKGDVVVDLEAQDGPPRGRIAFEVKTSRLSFPDAVRTLDAARDQRSAGFAVLVVPSDERAPSRMRPLQELHGDKLVVTYDPAEGSTLVLETGYALARARVLMARAAADGVDAAAVEDAARRALELLGQVKAIKAGLTAAQTQIGKSSGAVDALAKGVRDQLDEICELAAAGAEEPVSA